jgi:RNA polymerase subunit RPABC4/transcription elongation factor Spt4
MPTLNLGMRGPGGVADTAEQGIFCPSCNTAVSRNWATCPHCGYRKYTAPDLIRRRCTTCGTELQKDWNACPYCSTTITEPVTASAPGPAQTQGPTSTALM